MSQSWSGMRYLKLSFPVRLISLLSRPDLASRRARRAAEGMGGAEPRAAPRAWRAPDLPRSEHRGRLAASRVLGLALALLALFEAIAVAVHFEDVDVVGQPIEQRAGQPLGPEHAGPLVERQITGDEDGAALVTLAEDLKQKLCAGRRQGHIAELIGYSAKHRCDDDAIDSPVSWQIAKASTAGFITGIGGILTLPIAIPANLGVLYIQILMIGAIAHLRGYDVRSDQVRTLAFACLAGSAALDILKDLGINIGAQLTRQIIFRISGEVLKRINRAVGFRLVTKAGTRGVINLVKVVPLVGGFVGGALDAATTNVIGRTAKPVFVPIRVDPESA